MKLRLSVIVPFYNVELYIEECIYSLYNQDIPWNEYEVICVDDCSLDNSRNIVESLQKKFPTLKLISHDENKKVGGARNTGLKEAKGQYIWYVDSDDYIYPNTFSELLKVAEHSELEILQFDYTRDNRNKHNKLSLGNITTGENYLFLNASNDWFYKISGPWKQIFKRDFLYKSNLLFIEGVMYEDTDYLLRAFLLAKKVQYVSAVAYHYRINADSATIAPMSPIKLAWRVNQIGRCCKLIEMTQVLLAKKAMANMISYSLSQLRKEVKKFSLNEKREYINHLKDTEKCKFFVSWRTWLAVRYGITWFI